MQNEIGEVLNLTLSQKGVENRILKEELFLDELGVLEDKFYSKDINRSVLIASKHSYEMAKEEGIDISYGQLGENILINENLYNLDVGTQIKISNVILELSQGCTLCKSLAKVNNKLPKLLKDDRGVFFKVVQSGVIKKNDKVYLLK